MVNTSWTDGIYYIYILTYSVEDLKLFLEMSRGKAATDKLFNEVNWLIVHSLKVLKSNVD